jgi:hypothetical protein
VVAGSRRWRRVRDMRAMSTLLTTALIAVVVAGCAGAPVAAGWRGDDIHLLDGVWIGTEYECDSGDVGHGEEGVECRTIMDRAKAALEPSVPNSITRMVMATLPRTYLTAEGKELTPRINVGILTRKAVVIDRVDGSRQVIGLWCHLPRGGDGRLHMSEVTCDIGPLEDWRDGTVPPSYDPARNIP